MEDLNEQEQQDFERIWKAFRDKLNEGNRKARNTMRKVDDLDYRNRLASADPAFSKLIERNPREVVENAVYTEALSQAIAYAIVLALRHR